MFRFFCFVLFCFVLAAFMASSMLSMYSFLEPHVTPNSEVFVCFEVESPVVQAGLELAMY